MRILLLQDEGTSADSVTALCQFYKNRIRCVSGHELQNPNIFDEADLIIIPGGRSLPFYEKLGEAGNQNIKNFVRQGGAYLGLCAGAYYASQQTVFAKNLPLELLLSSKLNFFEGAAIGPVFAENEFAYGTENGARWVEIIWNDGKTDRVYFNGGCYFEGAEADIKASVLARYKKNGKAAIIACSVGLGYAILSGVHPELSINS